METDDAYTVSEERLFSSYSGRILASVSMGYWAFFLGALVLSPLLPTIINELNISSTQAGFALTVLWGSYAITQYPSGQVSDKLSYTTVLIASLGVGSVGYLLLAGAVTYHIFLFGALVAGIGMGMYPPAAIGFVSRVFVERRGRALGSLFGIADSSGVFAALFALGVIAAGSWRLVFVPIILSFLVSMLLLHRWSQEGYKVGYVSIDVRKTIGKIFSSRKQRLVLVAIFLYGFTWQGTISFLPFFLEVEKGFSTTFASIGFASLWMAGLLSKPLFGELGDRFGYLVMIVCSIFITIIGLASLLLASSTPAIWSMLILFSIGLMGATPVIYGYLAVLYTESSFGGTIGAFRAMFYGVGSLSPTYVGYTAEVASYTAAFGGLLVSLIVSICIIIIAVHVS